MSETYAVQSIFGQRRDEFVESVPHCREIGMQNVSVGAGTATMKIPFREDLVGDPGRGVVFGGVITTLLDQAGGAAVLCSLPELVTIATLDLRIDYLRPAEPGCDLYGMGEVHKRTRSVAFVRGKAWDRDPEDPFAQLTATFMLGSSAMDHPLKRVIEEQSS